MLSICFRQSAGKTNARERVGCAGATDDYFWMKYSGEGSEVRSWGAVDPKGCIERPCRGNLINLLLSNVVSWVALQVLTLPPPPTTRVSPRNTAPIPLQVSSTSVSKLSVCDIHRISLLIRNRSSYERSSI